MDQEISTIDTLPNEVLLTIFSFISGHQLKLSVSKVCRRWEHLVSHIMLKYPADELKIHGGVVALLVTFRIPPLLSSSALLLRIATLIPHLKELTISVDYGLDESNLLIIQKLHSLRHLDIFVVKNLEENTPIPCNITSLVVNNNMAPKFLCEMTKANRVIKAFHMYGRSKHYQVIEMERFLKHHSAHLSELTLRCSEFTERSYKTLSLCEGLTSLQLYCCYQLTATGAYHLTKLTKLRCLHLTGARMLRTHTLLHFIHYLPRNIEELNLSYSCFGSDLHCSALVAALPNLRCFELWRSGITTSRLVGLIKQLKSLKDFDTDAIFDDCHMNALRHHQSLKNIRCRWIGQINTTFHIKSAEQPVSARYLREDEEGPSSGLFYYWLQAWQAYSGSFPEPRRFTRESAFFDLCRKNLYDSFAKSETDWLK